MEDDMEGAFKPHDIERRSVAGKLPPENEILGSEFADIERTAPNGKQRKPKTNRGLSSSRVFLQRAICQARAVSESIERTFVLLSNSV